MTKHRQDMNYHEFYEYHGNTTIEFIKKLANTTISRDWIIFDSVEEAIEFFNDNC
jgi:hypothetical protein